MKLSTMIRWVRLAIVSDVPPALSACEAMACPQCSSEAWETCRVRLQYERAESPKVAECES